MSDKELQTHINSEVKEQLKDHAKHLQVANEEMGVVQTDIAWLKKEFGEMKGVVKGTDSKMWGLAVGILLIILRVYIGG